MTAPADGTLTWPAVDRRRNGRTENAVPPGVYTLRAFVSLISRRRFPLAATFLLLFAAACAVTLMLPKQYEAEAKLMIKRARVDAPLTLERGAATTVPADMTEAEVSAEIELLRSRDLLEEVANSCRLIAEKGNEGHREALARAVRTLEKDLKIGPIGKTNLIAVHYKAAEPEVAARVVNTLVEGYLRKHVAVHRMGNTSVFFQSQAANFQKELSQAQQQMDGFRTKDGVSSLPDQKSAALRRMGELEAAVQEAESGIRDAENRARLLRQQQAGLPDTIETGSHIAKSMGLIERLKGQLLELQNKRTELLTKYEPGYRLVKEVEKQIQDTRAALEHEQSPSVVDRTAAPNPLRQSIEADLLRTEASIAGLKARRASLAQDLGQTRARLQKLDTLTGTHDDLQRRLKMAEENFLLYQKKEEELRLEDALDQQRILNVSIVEKAAIPAEPAPRHRSVILMIGLLVAGFGSIAAAFVTDYFLPAPGQQVETKPSIRTKPVAAQSIPAPVAAAAPKPAPAPVESKSEKRQRRPEPPPPVRPATNADRAAFVAAGLERHRTPGLGLKTAEAIYAGPDHRQAPALAQGPAPSAPARQETARKMPASAMRDRVPPAPAPKAAPVPTAPRVQPTAPVPAPAVVGGRISAAYRTLTSAAAPAMPPVAAAPVAKPVARPAVVPPKAPPAPLKPSGFLGDYAGGSVRRLFEE